MEWKCVRCGVNCEPNNNDELLCGYCVERKDKMLTLLEKHRLIVFEQFYNGNTWIPDLEDLDSFWRMPERRGNDFVVVSNGKCYLLPKE
jgi:hypothetical protein